MDRSIEVAEVFREMPSRFRKGKTDRELSYYFSIEGEEWTVFVGPETCEIKQGKAVENADCYLKTSKVIFIGTVTGQYTPSMTDLIRGKIKTNNPFLLQSFREIFGE
jgi:putative sterol carrier protein